MTTAHAVSPMSTSSPASPKKDQFKITFQGRKYRIYKNRPGENYSIRIQRHGKDINRSLGTPLPEIARKQAITILTAIFSDTWEDQDEKYRQKSAPISTLGSLLDLYEKQAAGWIGIKRATAKRNAGQLERIVSIAAGSNARSQPLDKLTDDLARDYLRKVKSEGRTDASIRSTVNQARSLFAPKLLHYYRQTLHLPKAFGFSLKELNLKTKIEGFQRIPEETIHRMEKAALTRLRIESPSAWRAYLLMARLGLRNSEVVAVRRHWFEELNGSRLLVLRDRPQEQFKLKNSLEGSLGVPDELWQQLTEGLAEEWDYLLDEKTATLRHDAVYRTLNQFVKEFLPDREKGAYELRKWAGSIVATRSGIYVAQQFLRHKSVKVTESYYAHYLRNVEAVSGADLASLYRGSAVTI